jgi:hypothetical protein
VAEAPVDPAVAQPAAPPQTTAPPLDAAAAPELPAGAAAVPVAVVPVFGAPAVTEAAVHAAPAAPAPTVPAAAPGSQPFAVAASAGAPPVRSSPLGPARPETAPLPGPRDALRDERGVELADALAAAVERLRARADAVPPAGSARAAEMPAHKASLSTIGRWKLRRRLRREQRSGR